MFEWGGLPYLDFMAKLASVVPRPRTNLIRFDGVLALNIGYRERVTPVSVGKFRKPVAELEIDGLEESDLTVGKLKGLCCILKEYAYGGGHSWGGGRLDSSCQCQTDA